MRIVTSAILVRRHVSRADAAEDRRERVERQELPRHLQSSRHADVNELARRLAVAERAHGSAVLGRVAGEEGDHHGELDVLRRGRREAATRHAEARQPPVAVDEAVRRERVHHVPADADDHRRARVAERLPVVHERQERPYRRGAVGHRGEEVARVRDHPRIEAQEDQHGRHVAAEDPHDDPQSCPEEGPCRRVPYAVLRAPLSDGERRAHLHRAHQSEDERVVQEHERRGDADAADRRRAQAPHELRVDEPEERVAEHAGGDRPCEGRKLAHRHCGSFASVSGRSLGRGSAKKELRLQRPPPRVSDPTFQSTGVHDPISSRAPVHLGFHRQASRSSEETIGDLRAHLSAKSARALVREADNARVRREKRDHHRDTITEKVGRRSPLRQGSDRHYESRKMLP